MPILAPTGADVLVFNKYPGPTEVVLVIDKKQGGLYTTPGGSAESGSFQKAVMNYAKEQAGVELKEDNLEPCGTHEHGGKLRYRFIAWQVEGDVKKAVKVHSFVDAGKEYIPRFAELRNVSSMENVDEVTKIWLRELMLI